MKVETPAAALILKLLILKCFMSYSQIAQLELLNAVANITTEGDLNEFKNLIARFFANIAQREMDSLWDSGIINANTIEEWGNEHMRTPYRHENHCS